MGARATKRPYGTACRVPADVAAALVRAPGEELEIAEASEAAGV